MCRLPIGSASSRKRWQGFAELADHRTSIKNNCLHPQQVSKSAALKQQQACFSSCRWNHQFRVGSRPQEPREPHSSDGNDLWPFGTLWPLDAADEVTKPAFICWKSKQWTQKTSDLSPAWKNFQRSRHRRIQQQNKTTQAQVLLRRRPASSALTNQIHAWWLYHKRFIWGQKTALIRLHVFI